MLSSRSSLLAMARRGASDCSGCTRLNTLDFSTAFRLHRAVDCAGSPDKMHSLEGVLIPKAAPLC